MKSLSKLVLAMAIATSLVPGTVAANTPPTEAALKEPWWKSAVIYEIYPRSFADAKNTGTGNLKGITQKLEYLADLGVTALWLTPCYPSPQVDFGYDISDYCAIDPAYGTMEDFDELVKEAKKKNIRILMDLVMNHTSDKHKWFEESKASRDNPKRDWFIWKDGKGNDEKQPPNNWLALFGHSAWQYDPNTKQFYYHFFYPEQPDLNWRNPSVKNAMWDVVRFWLDKGVAGFRLDAINTLYEDPDLTDNPVKEGKNAYGDPNMDNKYNYLLMPEIHATLKELRKVVDKFPDTPVLLGETTAEDIDRLVAMYGQNNDEIQLPMDFRFAYVDKLSAPLFRERIREIDTNNANGWPTYLFSNHDRTRHYDRYVADLPNKDTQTKNKVAKLLAALLLTVRGTPVMYYGEEIGMENRDPEKLEEVQDPIGKIGWPKEKGRDGERTPMQWSSSTNAGFSTAAPWVKVANNYKTNNVETEQQDPNSILNFYKALLRLRKTDPALRDGTYKALNTDDKSVLSYVRQSGTETVLVSLNMSPDKQTVSIDPSACNIKGDNATVLLSSSPELSGSISVRKFNLEPFTAALLRMQ
jgi:alpha-glucosidase